MKLDIKVMDATLDEVQALIDAEKNAGVVEAIREAVRGFKGSQRELIEEIQAILGAAGAW
jgi:hypothetical protein